jgi:hypothetical protein
MKNLIKKIIAETSKINHSWIDRLTADDIEFYLAKKEEWLSSSEIERQTLKWLTPGISGLYKSKQRVIDWIIEEISKESTTEKKEVDVVKHINALRYELEKDGVYWLDLIRSISESLIEMDIEKTQNEIIAIIDEIKQHHAWLEQLDLYWWERDKYDTDGDDYVFFIKYVDVWGLFSIWKQFERWRSEKKILSSSWDFLKIEKSIGYV